MSQRNGNDALDLCVAQHLGGALYQLLLTERAVRRVRLAVSRPIEREDSVAFGTERRQRLEHFATAAPAWQKQQGCLSGAKIVVGDPESGAGGSRRHALHLSSILLLHLVRSREP